MVWGFTVLLLKTAVLWYMNAMFVGNCRRFGGPWTSFSETSVNNCLISGFRRGVNQVSPDVALWVTAWRLKVGPIGFPETSLAHQSTLCNIPEEGRPQLTTSYQDVTFKEFLYRKSAPYLHFAACCFRLFFKLFVQHESLRADSRRVGCSLLLDDRRAS